MKKLEKFAFWAAVISLSFFLLSSLGLLSMSHWVGSDNSRIDAKYYDVLIQVSSYYIPQVLFGIWLYWEALQKKFSKLTWGLFGLTFGIYGVALFYILLIYFNLISLRNKMQNET